MRIYLLLLLLLGFSASAQNTPAQPDWKPIYGYKTQVNKGYFDARSIVRKQEKEGDFSSGTLLIVSPQGVPAKTDSGETILVHGMVRSIVMDCQTGITATLVVMYFIEEFPTRNNVPVGTKVYDMDEDNLSTFTKGSPIFLTWCGTYI
jgi:hypothetical protein